VTASVPAIAQEEVPLRHRQQPLNKAGCRGPVTLDF